MDNTIVDELLARAETLLEDSDEFADPEPATAKLLALRSMAASQLAIARLLAGQAGQDMRDALQSEFESALKGIVEE